jgi:polyhydroxybutyrate depolymerase
MTALDAAAGAAGMTVVFPESLDGGWGDDPFTTPTRPTGGEDVAFLDRLVDELHGDGRIAAGPPALVGFSNGASMALRYAAEHPAGVRAVVSVAGELPRDPAVRPMGPVPLLAVYGSADPVRSATAGIPASPGRRPGDPTPTLPIADTVAAFVASLPDPVADPPVERDPHPGDGTSVRRQRWTGRDGTPVELHTVVGGGHTWPSARGPVPGGERFGAVSRDLDATALAVAFVAPRRR